MLKLTEALNEGNFSFATIVHVSPINNKKKKLVDKSIFLGKLFAKRLAPHFTRSFPRLYFAFLGIIIWKKILNDRARTCRICLWHTMKIESRREEKNKNPNTFSFVWQRVDAKMTKHRVKIYRFQWHFSYRNS